MFILFDSTVYFEDQVGISERLIPNFHKLIKNWSGWA